MTSFTGTDSRQSSSCLEPTTRTRNHWSSEMALKAVVSYDDTPNDQDALALAEVLAAAGAELTLAYVRHTTQDVQEREQLEDHEAQALLERGARSLGNLDVE